MVWLVTKSFESTKLKSANSAIALIVLTLISLVVLNPLPDVDWTHKHVTSFVKVLTTPFNHKYTSQFKRKEL